MRITDMGMVVLEPTRPLDPARASERWRCGAVMDFASAYPESTVSQARCNVRRNRAARDGLEKASRLGLWEGTHHAHRAASRQPLLDRLPCRCRNRPAR